MKRIPNRWMQVPLELLAVAAILAVVASGGLAAMLLSVDLMAAMARPILLQVH